VAWSSGFGRPQGLAFDAAGHLYVVDALAGSSALYRIRLDAPHAPELMLSGGSLIGLAFDPHGGIALATSEDGLQPARRSCAGCCLQRTGLQAS
jgi:hypothetical protein